MLKEVLDRFLLKDQASSQWLEENFPKMISCFADALFFGTKQQRIRAKEMAITLSGLIPMADALGERIKSPDQEIIAVASKAIDVLREKYPDVMKKLGEYYEKRHQEMADKLFESVAKVKDTNGQSTLN